MNEFESNAASDMEISLLMNRSACQKYPNDINLRIAHNEGWKAARALLATGGQAQAEHIKALIEVSRMPNQEHVADAHNAAVRHLRAIAAAKGHQQ